MEQQNQAAPDQNQNIEPNYQFVNNLNRGMLRSTMTQMEWIRGELLKRSRIEPDPLHMLSMTARAVDIAKMIEKLEVQVKAIDQATEEGKVWDVQLPDGIVDVGLEHTKKETPTFKLVTHKQDGAFAEGMKKFIAQKLLKDSGFDSGSVLMSLTREESEKLNEYRLADVAPPVELLEQIFQKVIPEDLAEAIAHVEKCDCPSCQEGKIKIRKELDNLMEGKCTPQEEVFAAISGRMPQADYEELESALIYDVLKDICMFMHEEYKKETTDPMIYIEGTSREAVMSRLACKLLMMGHEDVTPEISRVITAMANIARLIALRFIIKDGNARGLFFQSEIN